VEEELARQKTENRILTHQLRGLQSLLAHAREGQDATRRRSGDGHGEMPTEGVDGNVHEEEEGVPKGTTERPSRPPTPFECKICMDAWMDHVFLPCGHFLCCSSCALSMRACPVCNAGVDSTVPVYRM
jgi:hypothetical protein